jgi:hypothetical protein
VSDRPVHLVLDTSAIVAFTRESIHVGEVDEIVGGLDAASAALAAVDSDVDVLTARPRRYGGMSGGGPVIPI